MYDSIKFNSKISQVNRITLCSAFLASFFFLPSFSFISMWSSCKTIGSWSWCRGGKGPGTPCMLHESGCRVRPSTEQGGGSLLREGPDAVQNCQVTFKGNMQIALGMEEREGFWCKSEIHRVYCHLTWKQNTSKDAVG